MNSEEALNSYARSLPIGQHKKPCPICSHTRSKNKRDLCLSLKIDSDGMVYTCHHCKEEGAVMLKEKGLNTTYIGEQRMKRVDIKELTKEALTWLDGRGISKETAEAVGIFSSVHWINLEGANVPCIGFPYKVDKTYQGAKIRSLLSKGFSCTSALRSFFNINSVNPDDLIIICEGEVDALSFIQAGFPTAVSVPNGAVAKLTNGTIDPKEDKTFSFLWDAKKELDQASKIIIATDSDKAGQTMAEEIARRIGKDRCWKIDFPDGCKDANEVLVNYGEEALADLVNSSEPWPISGIHSADYFADKVREIYEHGLGEGLTTGYTNLDEFYTVALGQLTVVTGIPSSGKSEFIDQIMVNQAMQYGMKFAVCSFENQPHTHISKLVSKYKRMPFFEGKPIRLSKDELEESLVFIDDHFTFLTDTHSDLTDLDGLIDRVKIAVMRYGVRGVVIDPYNYIKRGQTDRETDWISEMLTKVRVFAQAYDCHVWFVAHPTKMQKENGHLPIPKGYDISGSAAWFAKADCGITVHRPSPSSNATEIHVWKCRFSWVGKQGECGLIYDELSSTYREAGFADRYSGMKATDKDFPATPF